MSQKDESRLELTRPITRPIKRPIIIKERISAEAWDLRERLEREGVRAWGIVCSGDEAEIYVYEDEEREENVRTALTRIRDRKEVTL